MAQRGQSPCPDPDQLASAVPSDMSTVQGDIDRLTLCVERANLIQQLDELIKKREEMLNPPAKEDRSSNQFDRRSDRSARLQQIRRDQMDYIPKLDSEQLVTNQGDQKPPLENPKWFVQDIKGSGDRLTAQLQDENGRMVTVSLGDQLPTGQVVSNISVIDGVAVKENGDSVNLPWAKG